MSDTDDQKWLDALRGDAGASNAEGSVLREAVKAHRERIATSWPLSYREDIARENELIARARREGLLPPPQRARYWTSLLAAAAVIVFAAGTVWLVHPVPKPVQVVRGAEPVVLTSSNPTELKQRILADLRAAGVNATGYEALGTEGIDADIPMPVTQKVQQVLDTYQIPTPADGELKIEIRER